MSAIPPQAPKAALLERKLLVTLHYPIDAHCAAQILRAIGRAYPDARIDEQGRIWDRKS